jgi:probable rRNA maturation factor
MNILDIQNISKSKKIPTHAKFQTWLDAVLIDDNQDSEVVIRIVDEDEMILFNEQYRNKKSPTNILSFPFQPSVGIDNPLLGDLLVCAPVIEKESHLQNKKLDHHWAHMIVHGVLHLLGYDHVNDIDAEEMENLEIKILNTINIKNPYQEELKK